MVAATQQQRFDTSHHTRTLGLRRQNGQTLHLRYALVTATAVALLAAACANDDTPEGAAPDVDTNGAVEEDVDDSADEAVTDEDDATDDDAAEDISGPQAYSSLLQTADPAVETDDGEVTITLGPAGRSDVPFLIHNGTDAPISRVEVSGSIVNDAGDTLGSGRSQTIAPTVIEPGGVGFGFVYAGPDDLPSDATVDSPSVDYTTGLGDFENIVAVDVEEVTALGDDSFDDFTGTISNPHDIDVTGPLSVSMACLDDDGSLTGVFSTYADRDDLETEGTSTFTIGLYGDDVPCGDYLAGASGYSEDF